MNKVIAFNKQEPKKISYIILVGEDETPSSACQELQKDIVTIMVKAKTIAGAEQAVKECTTMLWQGAFDGRLDQGVVL